MNSVIKFGDLFKLRFKKLYNFIIYIVFITDSRSWHLIIINLMKLLLCYVISTLLLNLLTTNHLSLDTNGKYEITYWLSALFGRKEIK